MKFFFLRLFFVTLIVAITSILFLNYFGIETDRFDKLIKNKANNINQNVKLDFNKVKIYINIRELGLLVKLKQPKIIIKNNTIDITKLNLFLLIKSFYNPNFILKKANIAFKKNDIKDLTKITNIFFPKIINNELNKIFESGNLEGEFIIPFKRDGSIEKNLNFSGKVLNASINLSNEFRIKDLSADININYNIKNIEFVSKIKKGFIYDLDLSNSQVTIKKVKNNTKIESSLQTKGKLNFSQIKKISLLSNLDINKLKNASGAVDIKTNINFNLNKNFKINNLLYKINGVLDTFEIETKKSSKIEEYFPNYKSKIIIKNTNINFAKSKNNQTIDLDGLINIGSKFDKFKINETFDYNKKIFDVKGTVDLTNSIVNISQINYIKNNKKKSELIFSINFILDKFYNINNLSISSNEDKISLSKIKLNNKFEIENFKSIKIITFLNGIKNNDFQIEKKNNIIVKGDVYDAKPFLESLFQDDDKKNFSKKFSSEVKVNFNNVFTGTNDDVSYFAMIASINKGSFNKLSLKGNFSESEIIEMSIYQTDNETKTLQVISDRARPFIKNFDFIEGFEDGKLEYESISSKEITNSNLKITDFKVSKVPALAKLLTLASLQGIADTLSGEGIRFDIFEMKSNTVGNVMNIEDALAMGPAVSILLDGYVDKGSVVSLRGTLVPATKLNSIIAKIPVVGNILVGKKTGEGVVGVSFKMKGPPKDIKTSVNPIKTLTPRFIVRAVEKMKKKKKEEAK